MYKYVISSSTPEGIDWCINLIHDVKFSYNEFEQIAEAAIIFAFEKEFKTRGYALKSDINRSFVLEFLLNNKGFKTDEIECWYDIEPYCSENDILSIQLKEWVNRENSSDCPPYMKNK